MFKFIAENLSTIIVGTIIALIIISVLIIMIKDKKQGKNLCGTNCSECIKKEKCNTKNKK